MKSEEWIDQEKNQIEHEIEELTKLTKEEISLNKLIRLDTIIMRKESQLELIERILK